MTGDSGPGDHLELAALVDRARARLTDWTDHPASDPGVALLDLFAFVGDLLSTHADRLAAEAALDTSASGTSTLQLGDGVRGRRPRPDAVVEARYRHGGGAGSVLHQQGRVELDADLSEAPARALSGVHRATVRDDADPLGQHRLWVEIPDLDADAGAGAAPRWAAACLPASRAAEVPEIGAGVWVAFESGDPARPVWLGLRLTT